MKKALFVALSLPFASVVAQSQEEPTQKRNALSFLEKPVQVANIATCIYEFNKANTEGNWSFPHLFTHPQDGKFKIINPYQDKPDNSNWDHFYGSALLSGGMNAYFDTKRDPDAILKTAMISLGLGVTKEIIDGYREGFGGRDLAHDAIGTATGIALYQGGKWLVKEIF